MKVLFEATAALRPGSDRGIGRYLVSIRQANEALGHQLIEIARPMGSGRLSEFSALPTRQWQLCRRDYDVFHAPTPYYSGLVPRRPTVVSILDVIPLDVSEHARTGLKAKFFHRLAARADVVLTLSEHAASRIVVRLEIDPARIVVAPLPTTSDFTPDGPRNPDLPKRYVAAMADLRTPDPRKRAHWLQDVAGHLSKDGVALVVAGAGTKRSAIPGTIGLGRISDTEWAAVLRGADLMVYTSSYEGQGMPPLEAIACGTPVVAMRNTAIPEVVGAAGRLVEEAGSDAASLRHLINACRDLLGDAQQTATYRAACAQQAAAFSEARFRESVGNAYALARSGS